jgi:hypothetical protein
VGRGDAVTARFSVSPLIGASGGKSIRTQQSAAQLGDSQPGNLDTAIKNAGAASDTLSRPVSRGHGLDTIGRVLAIPPKRRPRNEICYLTDAEAAALLAAPDRTTRAGRRDHAMFQLAVTRPACASASSPHFRFATSIWAWVRTCSAAVKAARTEPHPWTDRPCKSSRRSPTNNQVTSGIRFSHPHRNQREPRRRRCPPHTAQ